MKILDRAHRKLVKRLGRQDPFYLTERQIDAEEQKADKLTSIIEDLKMCEPLPEGATRLTVTFVCERTVNEWVTEVMATLKK
jgi:hypothetical protein